MERTEVRTEICGTISEIVCKPGDRVAEGDAICIIEAMKMEMSVAAPCSGRVVEIHVGAGEVVPGEHLLATIDAS